jgi:hypothetical protein
LSTKSLYLSDVFQAGFSFSSFKVYVAGAALSSIYIISSTINENKIKFSARRDLAIPARKDGRAGYPAEK